MNDEERNMNTDPVRVELRECFIDEYRKIQAKRSGVYNWMDEHYVSELFPGRRLRYGGMIEDATASLVVKLLKKLGMRSGDFDNIQREYIELRYFLKGETWENL